jgi:hypothetical protein
MAGTDILPEVVQVSINKKEYGWFVLRVRSSWILRLAPDARAGAQRHSRVIKALYKHNRGMDIVAFQSRYPSQSAGEGGTHPWVTLPRTSPIGIFTRVEAAILGG